jgi:hypothetical protein
VVDREEYYCVANADFKLLVLFFFFVVLGLELRAYTLSHSTIPFCGGFFQGS